MGTKTLIKGAQEHLLPCHLTAGTCCTVDFQADTLLWQPTPIEWWLLLTSSWTSRSQPAFSKIWTTARWPLLAARCRGVRPCCWCKANTHFKTGHQNHTPGAGCTVALYPFPYGLIDDSCGFIQNSSLSLLTLAIGTVINEKNRLKMWIISLSA